MPRQWRFFPAAGVEPPTVLDSHFEGHNTTDDPQSIDTSGVTEGAAVYLGAGCIPTNNTIDSLAGATDDTATLLNKNDGTGPCLSTFSITVNGGSLDDQFDFSQSAGRRGGFGVLGVSGASGLNQSETSSGTGTGVTAPAVTTTAANALVLQFIGAEGGHTVSNIIAALPSGMTFIEGAASVEGSPGNTNHATIASASKVQETAGSVTGMDWTSCWGASQDWRCNVEVAEP